MSALYLAEIQGANGSASRVTVGAHSLEAHTAGRTDWVPLSIERENYGDPQRPALFASREAARSAGLAAVWNNQQYRVRAARGRAKSEGVRVGS